MFEAANTSRVFEPKNKFQVFEILYIAQVLEEE
jgi:hypothetical protein